MNNEKKNTSDNLKGKFGTQNTGAISKIHSYRLLLQRFSHCVGYGGSSRQLSYCISFIFFQSNN